MTQECANCSKCHKTGLPILLTRYAVAPEYNEELAGLDREKPVTEKSSTSAKERHGKGISKVSGQFKVTSKDGGPEVSLGEGTQYTLRLLRKGYVYVYNEKDTVKKLRCYEVSENALLIDTTPSSPPCNKECERRDVACNPLKSQVTAGLLTIPDAIKAKEVWIGFSDTKWTPAVKKLHEEDPDYRARHMRKVNVSDWMKNEDLQHAHAVNIHKVDPKQSPVAEYAILSKDAFSFACGEFHPREVNINLTRAKEVFVEMAAIYKGLTPPKGHNTIPPQYAANALAKAGYKIDNHDVEGVLKEILILGEPGKPLRDDQIEMAIYLANSIMLGGSIRRYTVYTGGEFTASPFEYLVQEVNRFYERAHSGLQKNLQYKNKGMILALDDPAGITQDLNGLILERQKKFKNSKKYLRSFKVGMCIQNIRAAFMKNNKERVAKEEAIKYQSEVAYDLRTSCITGKTEKVFRSLRRGYEQEEHDAILNGTAPVVQIRLDAEWERDYEKCLKSEGPRYEEFIKLPDRFEEFKKKFVTPLAEAHAKWMESDKMFHCFDCNYDTGSLSSEEEASKEGQKSEAADLSASEQSVGFTELFSRCVGRTAEERAGKELYVKWFTDDTVPLKRDLLWRALTLNQSSCSSDVEKAHSKLEAIQKELVPYARGLPEGPNDSQEAFDRGQEALWDSAAPILRNWTMTWWEVHTFVQEKLHAAFSPDPKARIKEMKEARKAIQDAKKLAGELAQEAKKLSGELAASAQQIQDAKKQSGQLAASQQQILSDATAAEGRRLTASRHYQVEKAKAIADSAKYQDLLKKVGQAEQAAQVSLKNSVGNLLHQMGGPLGASGAKKGSRRFKTFKTLVGMLNGTPDVGLNLNGTARAVGKAFASRFVEGGGRFGWGVFSDMVSGLPESKVSAKLPGTMSRKLLLDGMLLEARTPAFREVYAKLVAGLLDLLGEDMVGTLANLWRIDETYIKDVVRLRQLRREEERLRKEAERSSKSADSHLEAANKARAEKDALMKSYHDERAKHAEIMDSYHKETAKHSKIQKELEQTQKKVSETHENIKGRTAQVKGQEKVLSGLTSHGWPMVNAALAGWCYWSLKEELDKLGKQLGPEDTQYQKAADSLLASELIFTAAFAEMSYKMVSAKVVTDNSKWAAALANSAKVQLGVRVLGTAASTVSSAVFGYWDYQDYKVSVERGHEGWQVAYGISTILAGSSVVLGVLSFFAIWLVPWAVGFALAYAAFSFVVSQFKEDATQTWLMSCYLGISPSNYDEAEKRYENLEMDETLEMRDYALLGFERITKI